MVPRRDGGRIGFEGVEGGGGRWGGGEGASDNARPVFAVATLELSVAVSASGNSQTSATFARLQGVCGPQRYGSNFGA